MKIYCNDKWDLCFNYPAEWTFIMENDEAGSWSIPVAVAGTFDGGQRPVFMVNARYDEMLSPSVVTTIMLGDGSVVTPSYSPSDHMENSRRELPNFFDAFQFKSATEIRLRNGIPASQEIYTYASSGGRVTEQSVTAFCRGVTYQFICDMPESRQEYYMGIFDEILDSVNISYPPTDISWSVPDEIKTYGANDSATKEVTPDVSHLKKEYFEAIERGDIVRVKELLDMGMSLDIRDKKGANALILAAFGGYPRICDLLIERGIDVQAKDSTGYTALMTACESKIANPKLIRFLLEKGLDVNAASDGGGTALSAAAKIGHAELVSILLDHGADINAPNKRLVTDRKSVV